MYVVRHEFSEERPQKSQNGSTALILRSLDRPDTLVSFRTFSLLKQARKARGELYRLLFEVKGSWTAPPTHAVFAEWQVNDPTQARAFEESRRRLFELRAKVLETFAYDWLMTRSGVGGRYMILGLYGDEEAATRLCRDHPEIRKFTQANPPTDYSAHDRTGLRCFRVESRTS